MEAITSRLATVKTDELPAVERAALMRVHHTLSQPQTPDVANDVIHAFYEALVFTAERGADDASSEVHEFRRAFVENAPKFASPRGVAELAARMFPAIEDQMRSNPDTTSRAIACTAWMLTAVASGDRRPTTQLAESATSAVRMAVPTREVEIGPDNPGSNLLNDLKTSLGLDEWTRPLRGGVSWFPGRLEVSIRQRLVGVDDNGSLHELIASVPIVRDVSDPENALELLSELNEGASGHALIFDSAAGTVRSELSVVVHNNNASWLAPVTKMLIMEMIDLAEQRADLLAEVLRGSVAMATHPDLGPRPEPDEILGIVGGDNWPTRPLPDDEGFWHRTEQTLSSIVGGPGSSGPSGMTVEVPMLWDRAALQGMAVDQTAGTALLAIGVEDVLPWHEGSAQARVGPGVTFRCGLPLSLSRGFHLANELNASQPDSRPHRLGAWYARDNTLWLTIHLPSGALPPVEADQSGVITNLALGLLGRARASQQS
jgi:hypothetical protein